MTILPYYHGLFFKKKLHKYYHKVLFLWLWEKLKSVHMHIFNLLQQQFLLLNKVLGCCILATAFDVLPKVLSHELHFCHMNS